MSLMNLRIRFINLNVFLYHLIGVAIELHDVLEVLWDGRVVGTNSIEANLIQQLMYLSKDFLYDIFLDLPNQFYASDRDSCLEIL